MRSAHKRCVVGILSAVLAAQPVAGCASGVHLAAGTAARSTPPVAMAEGKARGPDLVHQRAIIAVQLVALGDTPSCGKDAAGRLTAEDLAVLLANPLMMQRAGALNELQLSYVLGAVVIGGIVALIVFADSGFIIIN